MDNLNFKNYFESIESILNNNSIWNKKASTKEGIIHRVNKTKYPTSIAIEYGNNGEWKIPNKIYDKIFTKDPKKGQKLTLRLSPNGTIISYQLN